MVSNSIKAEERVMVDNRTLLAVVQSGVQWELKTVVPLPVTATADSLTFHLYSCLGQNSRPVC